MAPVDDFTREMSGLRGLASQAVLRTLGSANLSSPASAVVALSDQMVALVEALGEQAAMSALRYLELDRESAGVLRSLPPVVLADRVSSEQTMGSLRWAVSPLGTGDVAGMAERLRGTTLRLVQQPARLTVWASTASAGTRYARKPRVDACPFCLMLASRGAVYTQRTVSTTTGRRSRSGGRPEGLQFHDDCACVPMEIRSDDDLPDINLRLSGLWAEHGGDLNVWSRYLTDNPFG